jgi:tetratricopeptide (TPR) repeat protein
MQISSRERVVWRNSLAGRRVLRTVTAIGLLLFLCGAGRPKKAQVQLRFGVDMAQQGAWKEAEFRFRRAAEIAPGDPEILNNLAVAYENNGRYEEAEQAYFQALEVDPQNGRIRENYERFRIFFADHNRKQKEREAKDAEPAGETDTAEGPRG